MTGDGTTPSEDHGLTAGSGTDSIGGASVSSLWKGLLLAGLLFLPGLLGFLFEGTSFTTGTALVCLVALMLAALGVARISRRANSVCHHSDYNVHRYTAPSYFQCNR
jgi:hypothetical protein